MYNLLLIDVSVDSTSRVLILVVRICPSPYTDIFYGDVSVSNTSRALVPVRIAPPYTYWYEPQYEVWGICIASYILF